jgi:hypothetical protein
MVNMRFDTKIAIAVRAGLELWQKLNVTAFLASGIAAAAPDVMGQPYEDGSGNTYLELFRQPVVVYAADGPALAAAHQGALARGMPMAICTLDMFATGHDDDNRPWCARSPRLTWTLLAWPGMGRVTPWTRFSRALRCTHESSLVPEHRAGGPGAARRGN